MTDEAERRIRFFEVTAERDEQLQAFHDEKTAYNAEFKKEVETRWRKENPRKVFTWAKAAASSWYKETYDQALRGLNAILDRHELETASFSKHLAELAEDLPLERTEDEVRWDFNYDSHYASQGYGAASYAKNSLKLKGLKAQLHGLDCEVREIDPVVDGGGSRCFGLFLKTTEQDLAILDAKPEPGMRDIVQFCWRSGANPRVYFPFLPHGFEEQNGLDFFGNDITAGERPARRM
jgi:hypothetical protein